MLMLPSGYQKYHQVDTFGNVPVPGVYVVPAKRFPPTPALPVVYQLAPAVHHHYMVVLVQQSVGTEHDLTITEVPAQLLNFLRAGADDLEAELDHHVVGAALLFHADPVSRTIIEDTEVLVLRRPAFPTVENAITEPHRFPAVP